MHSIYYNYAPDSSNDVWQKYSECNPEINLRNTDDLYIPQPRTEAFKKSTMYSLPSIWNELSPFVKLQTNKISFKWALNPNCLWGSRPKKGRLLKNQ
jgi:alpha-N-acetylglucosamine transferase